jgi:RNA polymerase sigma factor (sigma-70 family)
MAVIKLWPFNRSKEDQFDHLVRPHLKKLHQLAYRFTGNKSDAEDMVQDVLLKLYPRLQEMLEIEKPGLWLARVLYRHNIDYYRKQQRSPLQHADTDEDQLNELASSSHQPTEFVESEQTQMQLQDALNSLNDDQRDLVVLHDVEGYTLVEIQDILGVPLGTLKSRLNRSRAKLRDLLNKREPFSEKTRVS